MANCSNTGALGAGTSYKDPARQRLLIRITAQYIHAISQGQIDMDSAISIPCKAYGLSPLLPYNEGYYDGKEHLGTRLVDGGNIREAKALLLTLRGDERLRLLTELAGFFIFKSGIKKSDLDEASQYINEAIALKYGGSPHWKAEIMLLKAHLLDQYGLHRESQEFFTIAEKLCEQSGNALLYARALLNAGEVLHYGHPNRLAKFEKALAIFKSKNKVDKEIEALSLINIENFVAKRYDVAEVYLREIIRLQTKIDFHHQQYPFDALSWLSYRKGALTNALIYSNKSFSCLFSASDSTFIAFFYTRRGLIYERLFKYKEAMLWYDKALSNLRPDTRLFWYRAVMGKVGMLNHTGKARGALKLLDDISNTYPPSSYFEQMHFALLLGMSCENVGDFKKAELQYQTFLAMADKFPPEHIYDEFPDAFFKISKFYSSIGEIKKARLLLSRGNGFASTFDVYAKEKYYYNLYKIDSIEGRYLDAIKNQKLSFESMDSIFGYDQRKRAEELLVKYELEQKDKSIKLLNSQNQLERIKTEEAHRGRNITIAGLLLATTIILLLSNRYMMKKKTNHKLEANQRELDQQNKFLETLNQAQDKLLKEKEWLITELHDRVKNSLHTVISLLHSQSVYVQDNAAKFALKDSLRRVHAMSLIYQKLYRDESSSLIGMTEYIDDLTTYLHESFDDSRRVILKQNIEKVSLDVSQAIPLGLILTESVVNAFKHAFVNKKKGTIIIVLKYDGPKHMLLKISDDGIGFPSGVDMSNHNTSLGLHLIAGLSKQLNGGFSITSENGVQITVRFLNPANEM
ncbi:sensor histidine kinase [Dyadobacter chenhuakuii]|uniref:histidine kinase n=1 Tax=Dyadobacter chenhuakuii TaxID=2909339 RepID=A0A9X1TQF0_9BACT|nr:sensor histidine kinase [Dyadobacter chenhuakuii]MCF2496719.1 sensor histidine kinase [Dyadobacter chenhuakuii]